MQTAPVGASLQALVYDILPSTAAVCSYATGSRKLSANEQFFVGAQTGVSLLQTTQIKQVVSFIAANKVYTSANKTHNRLNRDGTFSLPGVDASHVYVRALALGCFYSLITEYPHSEHRFPVWSLISTQTFRRALTASVGRRSEIRTACSVA